MSESNPGLRVIELRKQIEATAGKRVVNLLRALDDPFRLIMLPNAAALQGHLSTFPFDSEGNLIFDAVRQDRMESYLGETLRLTHNLVASVGTVIDQARRVLRANWPDEAHAVRIAFGQALVPFQRDGQLQIVRDLRNYFLHRSLPSVAGKMTMGQSLRESATVELATSSLLEWDGWKKEARAELEASGDGVILSPLVSKYVQAAVDLHVKVLQAIEDSEQAALAEYRQLAQEHDAIVRTFIAGMERAQNSSPRAEHAE